MMADAPTSDSVQARAIFLFENERYSPLSGWSAKGLLPTDRKAFTTEDNMHGFNTIPEATEAFACLGNFYFHGRLPPSEVPDCTYPLASEQDGSGCRRWTGKLT